MTVPATMIRDHARAYQDLGLPAIPVRRGRPLVRWESFQHRPPAPDDMTTWPWDRADGLGVVLGHASPFGGYWWCWDVERPFRDKAEAWLDAEHPGWRKGLVAESQRGGLHLYCLSRRPVPTGKYPWGDIKGTGGLVFAPPTKAYKPDAVADYRWLSFEPEEVLELEPSDLPGWEHDGQSNGHHEPLGETLRRTIPIGARNVILTRVAGWLRGDGQLEPDEVLAVLRLINRRCEEPLPDSELEAIARSSGRWEPNPILITGNGHQSLVTPSSDSDGDDELAALPVWTLPEPEPRPWLVPGLLPQGVVTSLFGDDGTGKSVLATALAVAMAAGGQFLGHQVRQGTVLYCDTEFADDEFRRRCYQLARGMGLTAPPEGLWYYRLRSSLTSRRGQHAIADLVERLRPALVIVDSLTLGTWDADLKEAAATAAVLQFLESLEATVLVLDHIPKPLPGASQAYARPWGSFAKRAKARHALLLTAAEGGGVVVRVTKSNLARPGLAVGADIRFTGDTIHVEAVDLDDESLAGIEQHLPPIEQVYRALRQREAGTPDELAEETGLAPGTVKNKLTALRRQGRAEPLGDGRWRALQPATLVTYPGNGPASPSSLVTHYSDSDSDDDAEKHHICDVQAKIGEHGIPGEAGHGPGKPENPHQDNKIGEHSGCVVCGRPTPQWGSRRSRYCSDACRMKASRSRKETEPVDTITTGQAGFGDAPAERPVCLDCGQVIGAEGFHYRCPPCLKARYDALGRAYPERLAQWLEVHGEHVEAR